MAYSTKCVSFDGTNEYATAANSTLLSKERSDAWTMVVWFAAIGGNGFLLGKMAGATTYRGWGLALGTGYYYLLLRSDDASSNALRVLFYDSAMTDGRWHLACVTYDGSSLAAGVASSFDGSARSPNVSQDTLTGTIVNSANFWLGGAVAASAGWTRNFSGAQVAIYNRVLTLAEQQWIYNSGSPRDLRGAGAPVGLEAWWKCGDGDTHPTLQDSAALVSLPTVSDRSGSGYNGTATNMDSSNIVTSVPGGVASIRSMVFDGVNEFITMGDVLGFERTDSFSFSFWFKWAAGATGIVLSKAAGSSSYQGYQISKESSGSIGFWLMSNYGTGDYLQVTTVPTYNDSTWHHCTMTYGGGSDVSSVKIYVDGTQVSTTTVHNNLTGSVDNSVAFMLAGRSDGFFYYPGYLDEVTVYSKELLSSEVTWIYNSGAPRDPRVAGGPSNLVAWWPLGEGIGTSVGSLTMTNMESTDILNQSPDFSYEQVGAAQDAYPLEEDGHYQVLAGGGGTTTILYFKMRAQDSGASPPGYVTWVAQGAPDFAGAGYSGATPTPVGAMVVGSAVVAAQWEETA
jgi:hypothetical protein